MGDAPFRMVTLLALGVAAASCRTGRPEDAPPVAIEKVVRYLVVMQDKPVGVMSTVEHGPHDRETFFTYQDRGRGPRLRLDWTLQPDALASKLTIRGEDEDGNPVDEHFVREQSATRWKSPIDEGAAPGAAGFYVPASPVPEVLAQLARALKLAPGQRLPLLPAGEARLEVLTTQTVTGERDEKVTLYAVYGLQFGPSLVWLDEEGAFFGSGAPYLAVVRKGFEFVLPTLFQAQAEALSRRDREMSRSLSQPVRGPLFLRDVRWVDVRTGTAKPKMAVQIRDGWIVWIGPDAEAKPGPHATVVEGGGRTLVPGLWDLHSHPESMGELLHLAAGVVAVRDVGSDVAEALARRRATLARQLLGPRLFLNGLMDGEGSLAAPTKVIVHDASSAVAAVDRFASGGFDQVKIYNSVPPSLVAPIAERAHARGLRLSGHVPNGMTAEQAVRAGLDELHHAYFLFPSLLADKLRDHPEPMQILMREGPWLPLNGPVVERFTKLLVSRGVALDPTLALCESLYTGRRGAPSPALARVLDRLPLWVRRRVLATGVASVDPDDARKLKGYLAATVKLTGALHQGGVRLIAGSDGMGGFTLLRELELMQEAGLAPAEVLRIATLGAAEWMKRERELGTVEVGKRADLLLVDGDPLFDIGALRRGALVLYDGAILRPEALYRAISVQPMDVVPPVVRTPPGPLSGQ